MFCDTCPNILHLSEHQPSRIYTDGGRVVLTVCGDCHADITADNSTTATGADADNKRACISRHYKPINSLLAFAEELQGAPAPLLGGFLGSWY